MGIKTLFFCFENLPICFPTRFREKRTETDGISTWELSRITPREKSSIWIQRKRFGQNFLHDTSIIDKIVTAIDPKPGDNLVEIGPGLGAITEPVAELTDHLTVVELDKDLAHRLIHHPFLADKLTVHQGDAMQFDFASLINDERKLKVFGNLPYNVSTPLLFHLFEFYQNLNLV